MLCQAAWNQFHNNCVCVTDTANKCMAAQEVEFDEGRSSQAGFTKQQFEIDLERLVGKYSVMT